MVVELLLWGALLLLLWLAFLKKPAGLPPGRWGLPLVGYIPLTTKNLQEQMVDMRKKYGDIHIWRMGTQTMLFLHDQHLVREAFTRPELLGRPNWASFRFLEEEELGIISSSGLRWHNNRRFTLRQLRDLGMGKSKLVEAVHTQATILVHELKKQAGTSAPLPHALIVCIVNIIWQMVGGKQFSVTDPRLMKFERTVNDLVKIFGYVAVPDFLPWLHHILPSFLITRLFALDQMHELRKILLEYFDEEIEDHRATLDRDNPRDLIDGYLIEMEERMNDPDNTFVEKDMKLLILDLFFAGSETTSSTLIWMIYYLATYPHVQRKMQSEIDKTLPKGTLATLDDKPRLNYTEAVIHETMRKSSITAFGVQHMATEDTTLGGYIIPKGTIISSASVSIHHNSKLWENPNEFRPERWLDQEGKFVPRKDGFLPFGVGKRQCAGEALARMELLIFSTTLFQNLNFAIPPGKKLSLKPEPGNPFFRRYVPQDLMITVRD